MSPICVAADCAKVVLDKLVCEAVAASTLSFFAKIVDYLKNTLCFDINVLFEAIAILAVLCWIQSWVTEIIRFLLKIPKIIKNLFCGKFSLCLFDECDGNAPKPDKSSSSASSSESHDY